MPIPKKSATESADEFISRCIPTLIGEGKDADQAVAICYTQLNQINMNNENLKKLESLHLSRKYTNEEISTITPQEMEAVKKRLSSDHPKNALESRAFERVCISKILAQRHKNNQ